MITGATTSKTLLLALLLGTALLPVAIRGAASAQDGQFTLDQLSILLSMRPTRYATFEELHFSTLLSEPLRFRGTLIFVAPSRLEKRITAPYEETYIAEENIITYENKTKGIHRTVAIEDYPLLRALVQTLRATFAGDLAGLVKLYRLNLKGNSEQWELMLKPNQGALRETIASVTIQGNKERIARLEIHERTGDYSQMQIVEVR